MNMQDRLAALAAFYEHLVPASLGSLAAFYADDVAFKDPFNEVRGLAAVQRIFAHMFEQVDEPRFVVLTQALGGADGRDGFLTWEMHYRFRGDARAQCIRGASHVRFGADGRIALHRDYWDAAEELYEKLPLLGALMRLLKRRARAV